MYSNIMMLALLSSAVLFTIAGLFWSFGVRNFENVNTNDDADLKTYANQLKSVEDEQNRGLISPEEAGTVRLEIERRILDASRKQKGPMSGINTSGWVVAACLLITMLVSLSLYLMVGSPALQDQPLLTRIAALEAAKAQRPSQVEAEGISIPTLPQPQNIDEDRKILVDRLRQAVQDRPGDVRGLRLLVQQEIRLGNYVAARETQEALVTALAKDVTVEDLANLFDIMLYNADDYISPEAEAVLVRIRKEAPDLLLGQFYQGMLEIQTGRLDKAFQTWKPVAENSPPNAPWFEFVRGEMPALAAAAGVRYELPPAPSATRGPSAADIADAENLSRDDRQAMIESMVAGLSDRLANEGGTAAEWHQLIRAFVVLGQKDRANAIAQEAQVRFSSDPATADQLAALIRELGLE